jgi:protein-S-isoprenylcysteine O-methyltransferase Ste14
VATAWIALRAIVYATGFLALWTWVALLLGRFDGDLGGPLPLWSYPLAPVLLVLGGLVVLWCFASFIVQGRGTAAPFDAPRRMVAVGPYRHVRNPMYVGGALLLLGLALEQRSPAIALFVPAWWLLFHLAVVLYEEPSLRRRFGKDYEEYCRRTPRWVPRLTP